MKQVVLDTLVMSVESSEEVTVVDPIQNAACFSNRVHAPHGSTNVDCLDTSVASGNGTNSRATS
jgi:hypothetical protein